MAYIVSAEIEGLAGRKEPIKLEFDKYINIIYGLNGSGKTSLLKILHSAMKGDDSILHNVPFKSATVKIYSKDFHDIYTRWTVTEINSTPKMIHNKKNQLFLPTFYAPNLQDAEKEWEINKKQELKYSWLQSPPDPTKTSLTNWRHRYLPTARLHVGDEPVSIMPIVGFKEKLTEDVLDELFAKSVKNLWTSYSSQILRKVREAQERGLASILRAVLRPSREVRKSDESLDMDLAYNSVKKFLQRQKAQKILGSLKEFRQRYNTNKSLRMIVHDIYKIENDINQAMSTRKKLQELIERLYSGDKHVIFTEEDIQVKTSENINIGLESLSSGEKHMMRILVESLLSEYSTIIIDEPELSLHIDWQHDLVSNLQLLNPTSQFILATHSPEIMAEIPDEKIFKI